jgi:hypothetical protein
MRVLFSSLDVRQELNNNNKKGKKIGVLEMNL